MSIFKKVEKFNKEVIGIHRNTKCELSKDENDWLIGALNEEITEYITAYTNRDFIGQIDSIIDLIYFAAGALTRMGITAEQSEKIFNVVHACNMAKVQGRKTERSVQSDLDAIKPDDWTDPSAAIIDILTEDDKR